MSGINLRPWQENAIAKSLKWYANPDNEKQFLINAAPGAGKTICATVIAQKLIDLDQIDRIIVIAPRKEVVRQWAEDFKNITQRHMMRITGSDAEIEGQGVDVCTTWASVQGAAEQFQQICRNYRTLVICDEHHHAAVTAAWGKSADSAFTDAAYVLVLTGTPIRSDGEETTWFAYDSKGRIDHPEDGTYTLTYGEAVDLGYCRPITFHRHEGNFSVRLDDSDTIDVSGESGVDKTHKSLKQIKGLDRALDFYKLACTTTYQIDGITPRLDSYQGSMLEWGASKLDDIRMRLPNAGGLVIAPSIEMAEYMASLLEQIEGERPTVIHTQVANTEEKIKAFRNSAKRWIVSVAMISEGVDIKRLRVLVFLPDGRTELVFRQSMGRVVRTFGDEDDSRAYVVMPNHEIFDRFARRVESEMPPAVRKEPKDRPTEKVCSVCGQNNPIDATRCSFCGEEFGPSSPRFKKCHECGALNAPGSVSCHECGASFKMNFEISLNEAFRLGAISRGMDIDEGLVQEGEEMAASGLRDRILESGDEAMIKFIKDFPPETFAKFKRILNDDD